MATLVASSVADVISFMSSASPGDTITLASGNYSQTITKSNITKSSPFVKIKPANVNNPPRFTGQGIEWTNVSGFVIEGLRFDQQAKEGGTSFPTGSNCVFTNCSNITVQHCTIIGGNYGLNFRNGASNITIRYNEFRGCGQDDIRFLQGVNTMYLGYNWFHDPNINKARARETGRHSDFCQFAIISGWSSGKNVTQEFNYIDLWEDYKQGPFFNAENLNVNNFDTDAHQNVTLLNNFVRCGWPNGIFFNGTKNVTITRNVLRQFPGGFMPKMVLAGGKRVTGSVTNNVIPTAIDSGQNDQTTKSGNVVSSSAFPSGWVNLVPGTNVGPYTDGGVTPPDDTPTTPGASDWSIGEIVAAPGFSGRYTAVIYVPPTSVATDLAGARWSSAAVAETQGFMALTDLGDGTRRFRMQMDDGSNAHSALPNVAYTGIRFYWREQAGGPLSAASSDSKSFTFVPVTLPQVVSATLDAATYTVGQVATITVNMSWGTGTTASRTLAYQWKLDGSNVGTNAATYTTTGAGSLTCVVTPSTSAGTGAAFTTTASTVQAEATGPSIQSLGFDKPSYITGDVLTAVPVYTLGSGTLVSTNYDWYVNDDLRAQHTQSISVNNPKTVYYDFTVTTSVTSATLRSGTVQVVAPPVPTAPDADDWDFVAVVVVSTETYTGQLRFPVGSDISQAAVTSVQWSYDATNWADTTEVGVWTDSRRLFQLLPHTGTGDHAIARGETSDPIYIRITTANGTSAASATAKTFEAPPADTDPPPDTPPPAADDDDWSISRVVAAPGLVNRFTGVIRAEPGGELDDSTFIGVQWFGAQGIWGPTTNIGVDGDSAIEWRMEALTPGGSEHTVQYGETLSGIYMRYITALTSDRSETSKSFSGPALPTTTPPQLDPGTCMQIGGDYMTLDGRRMIAPQENRPSGIKGDIPAFVDIDGNLQVTPPPLVADQIAYLMVYNSHAYVSTSSFTVPYVEGVTLATVRAVNSAGVSSISRYVRIG